MWRDEFDEVVNDFREALRAYVRGNAEPVRQLFSTAEDVTLANPLGPPRRGPSEVTDGILQGAESFQQGGLIRFQEVTTTIEEIGRLATPDLGYVLQMERHEGRLVTGKDAVVALRVTLVFRPEDGSWKVIHRHADPITTPRPVTTAVEFS